jgi:hypothetical protein
VSLIFHRLNKFEGFKFVNDICFYPFAVFIAEGNPSLRIRRRKPKDLLYLKSILLIVANENKVQR